MRRTYLLAFFALFLCAPGFMSAADADGKWTCEMKEPNGPARQVTANLKSDGMKLSGSISIAGAATEIQITNGMNHGTMVMWSASLPAPAATGKGASSVAYDFKGMFMNGGMKIERVRADGQGDTVSCMAQKSN